MEMREGDAHISPTEDTVPFETEQTLAAPRFDEKSVQSARPAVPLTRRERVRSWPWKLAVLCVAGGLLGGMLGALALTAFQRRAPRAETAQTTQMQARPENVSAPAEQQAATTATTSQEQGAQATQAAGEAAPVAAEDGATKSAAGGDGEKEADAATQGELRSALGEWLAATNARDVGRQMNFYAPTVGAFYLSRNASRESVRAEKNRVFARASSVAVEASAPDIRLSRDGQTAVMRFRKRYRIGGEGGERSGEVLQELRWRRTPSGWKIVSERDLRVLQ